MRMFQKAQCSIGFFANRRPGWNYRSVGSANGASLLPVGSAVMGAAWVAVGALTGRRLHARGRMQGPDDRDGTECWPL